MDDQEQLLGPSADQAVLGAHPPYEEERGEAAYDQGPAAAADSQDSLVEPSSGRSHEELNANELIQGGQSARARMQQDKSSGGSQRSMGGKSLDSKGQEKKTRSEVNKEFFEKQSWELWVIFIMKMVTSLVFLIDDLTFLVYCEYEFQMTQQEAGVLFCVSAIFLFTYGLTISGYLIDKLGVKYSLMIGFVALTVAKFMLTFVDSLTHLYIIMCTISPFGISIIFPCLVLGVKKLTHNGPVRSLAFSVFYAFMVLGALLGGPIVDFIRRDIGKTQFEYIHTNVETGRIERRYIEVSAWRTICFFGFILNAFMLFFLAFYDSKVEDRFQEGFIDHEALAKLTCGDIFGEIIRDHKFWRFMLFSFVIVGSKMVFSLLFFMIPKMLTQDDGEDAPFGVYVSIAPLLIIVFLFFLTPVQAAYPAYDLILVGCLIATAGPIPMFFGMNLWNFLLFIIIVSFAEALYAPMINVFTFNFTKEGREGTFLTLTAAPVYFTMALTGIVGGYLLENYYPADPDRKKRPQYIWATIIVLSALSTIFLYLGRNYFDYKGPIVETEAGLGSINNSKADIVSAQSANSQDMKNFKQGLPAASNAKSIKTISNRNSQSLLSNSDLE